MFAAVMGVISASDLAGGQPTGEKATEPARSHRRGEGWEEDFLSMAELNHRGVPSSAQGDRQQVWVMPPKPTLFTRVLKMQTTQSLGK